MAFMLIKHCILCQTTSKTYFCTDCYADLPWNHTSCQSCALPLITAEPQCGQCLQKSPAFDNTISVFNYDDPIDYLISQFKFQQQLAVGKLLSQLLFAKLMAYYHNHPKPTLVIPIPLHRKRMIERGYNQALELAKPIAKQLTLKISGSHAKRIRDTKRQSDLALTQRAKNVRGAFTSKSLKNTPHVAVVDDVITTGHTMQTFCQTLRHAGATQIDVWCIARTHVKR